MAKHKYYLEIAKAVASNVKCIRRQCGAVIVKFDRPIGTGYNGSVRGALNCGTETPCLKDLYNEAPLASYIHCPAVHGEENAIINAVGDTHDSTLYLYSSGKNDSGRPCQKCRQRIINAQIKGCWFMNGNGEIRYETIEEWINIENEWMNEQVESANSKG